MVNSSLRAARLSDEALLAAVALGDVRAASVFVERFQARVYGLAVTMLGDRHLAEEVAQEAFLKAWRHAGAYDARLAPVGPWLSMITRRLAIDRIRTRQPVPVDPATLLALAGAEAGEWAASGPERAGVARAELDRVVAALATVPAQQRRAVLLAGLGGQSAAEIAAAEDIPLGTAKTRIRQGLLKLRAGLAEREGTS